MNPLRPIPPCSKLCKYRQVGCRKMCDGWKEYEARLERYRIEKTRDWMAKIAYDDVVNQAIKKTMHYDTSPQSFGRPTNRKPKEK